MRDRFADTPTWHRQPPLDLASEPASSPTGRPYSPYPYRDLPHTSREWEKHAPAEQTVAAVVRHGDFQLFRYLPAELRLEIWSQAMLAACEHGKVHRVRFAPASSPTDDDDKDNDVPPKTPRLELAATPHLADSTRTIRSLLSTCSEARHQALTYRPLSTLLPDTLPLQNGGLFRCNLSKDILLLENATSSLLVQLTHPHNQPLLHSLSQTHHLGLDLLPVLQRTTATSATTQLPAETETALLSLAASLPSLTQISLLQPPATTSSGPPHSSSQEGDHIFLGGHATASPQSEGGKRGLWYTTCPPAAFHLDNAGSYYGRLARLVRALCQVRQAFRLRDLLDVDLPVEGAMEQSRVRGVRVRLLGQYFYESGGGGIVKEREESSPTRCLEVGLAQEPRWVQWEWVCQSLGC